MTYNVDFSKINADVRRGSEEGFENSVPRQIRRRSNQTLKGSFTYYVITKGEGVSEWLRYYVIFALSNADFG